MYDEFLYRNKRRIILGVAIIFALIIVWAVWTYFDRVGKTPLTISVVPSDAKVLVNNKSLGDGTHWLLDNTYKITIEKDGFKTQQTTVKVTGEKTTNVVAASLEPQSEAAKKWAADHQSDYKKNESFGALEARTNGQYFTDKNPITKFLPFNDPYFTIGYRAVGGNSIVLTVNTPSPRYRFYAVQKIRDLGYDPTDFMIEFTDFNNPLGQSSGR
jgi:hypothetical protein